MEYCSPVWSNATAAVLAPLDRIQRNCGKLFPSFKLDSLEHRRQVADLSVFHRLYHGSDVLPETLHLPGPYPRPRQTRQAVHLHSAAVAIPTGNRKYENSYIPRAARLWNALPQGLVEIEDSRLFRRSIHRHLQRNIAFRGT